MRKKTSMNWIVIFMASIALVFSACGENDFEDAGEAIDDTIEDVGDEMEDLGDDVQDAVE